MEHGKHKGGGCVGDIFHPIMSLGHADARGHLDPPRQEPAASSGCEQVCAGVQRRPVGFGHHPGRHDGWSAGCAEGRE